MQNNSSVGKIANKISVLAGTTLSASTKYLLNNPVYMYLTIDGFPELSDWYRISNIRIRWTKEMQRTGFELMRIYIISFKDGWDNVGAFHFTPVHNPVKKSVKNLVKKFVEKGVQKNVLDYL